MKRKGIFLVLALCVISAGLILYAVRSHRSNDEWLYSGTIEATQARLSFQVTGRVSEVGVEEGQAVEKGQTLASLERAEFDARVDQTTANLERAEKVAKQAEAAFAVLQKTLPAEVARAEAGLQSARDVLADALRNRRRYEKLFDEGIVPEKDRDTVRLAYEVAKSRLAESESLLHLAQGNLSRIEAARRDVEATRAQISVARAALAQAEIQRAYTRLEAPLAGVVTTRNIEPGETVNAGREVLTVSDLSRVDLKIYVEETRIGHIRHGQPVQVSVDSFPGRYFDARVSFVSPEGEFTPKIIQTQKERVKLVYLVKISIPNPGFELKTGMPADAKLLK